MNISFLRWDCNHQDKGELRAEKGKLLCEHCKTEVKQWVEPKLETISLADFPTLSKLSTRGAIELQSFAGKVQEWERARLWAFADGKNPKHQAAREVLKEYEAEKRKASFIGKGTSG